MTTQFSAQIRPPVHLIDQVDVFLNLAEEFVDLDSALDELAPETLPKTDHAVDGGPESRGAPRSRQPAKRPRGLAEVAAEASGAPD